MTIITAILVPWTAWIFVAFAHSTEGKCAFRLATDLAATANTETTLSRLGAFERTTEIEFIVSRVPRATIRDAFSPGESFSSRDDAQKRRECAYRGGR